MTLLQPGDTAPDFTLTSSAGEPVSTDDLRGRKVILYFYPAAGTPGCTAQACDFRDNLATLTGDGYIVVGISPDQPATLAEFQHQQALSYPLLADPDQRVHQAYGAWGQKASNGETATGVLRCTFVLDEDGRVEHALYDVPARGHVAELRRLLALGKADV